ncbi:alpha-D-ribose 1-methylphosphonate 5-triphosphate diphosphatase [Conexibacter sp. JD483]|uniref:alpha-D-ribose 1-methylphosphonate 5-triphosphate diphosphatase n=1 Tax=unclassified Conexibacter TaxID=2627773 RepID=UPI002722A6B1|nr:MULTISPECIES: alpha-D-ribose 1-methylphosphonate 5-triphosphate diphosphatase [unclassified Conexibacter]MDO8189051.1 alpha-D-ribose 1-methylphosphonate 5-triphosphate diphosphatase [Conexibacter sp. CPCC 205706]MDO8198508.1 alpha-D-ribose 1-methylphosphonate 5-triphosphate diphosphatase [Conexibacter sp. CPCC 205762]MDR9367594.1 alpha-D-ribose 1-methylphosphonate 5-triphosphate diphosphatase [Conexibacter sp. JD483]
MLSTIVHATAVTPAAVVEDATIAIEDGRIAGIRDRSGPEPDALDARGAVVMPGMVDLHSDAIEQQLMPRLNVRFPPPLAFAEVDRLLAGSAITTCFHAISLMLGRARTVAWAEETHDVVLAERARALVRHELHLRCELPQQESLEAVLRLLALGGTRAVSAMDHTPGQGQFRDADWYRRHQLGTGHLSEQEVDQAVARADEAAALLLGEEARERLRRLGAAAREHDALLLSHDDDEPERVRLVHASGARVSEFPITVAAARAARELGMHVCMGAPNVVRGVSTGGHLSAREAIALGVVDALVSDYHPASMLRAVFALAADDVLPLPDAVALATGNPARAAGLADRGTLAEGGLADLVVVEHRGILPSAIATVVGGRLTASFQAPPPAVRETAGVPA